MKNRLSGLTFFLWILIISPGFAFGSNVTYYKDYTNNDVLILNPKDKYIIKPGIHLYNDGTVQTDGAGILFSTNSGDSPGIFYNKTGGSLIKSGAPGTILIGDIDFKDTFGTIEVQTGTIEFDNGVSNFTGTAFIGRGCVKITSDAYFKSVQSDNLELANGTFTGYKDDAINGTVLWTGGQFAGSFYSKANLIVASSGSTRVADGGSLYNSWVVEAREDGLILSAADNSGTRGTFYNQPGSSLVKSKGSGTTRIGDVDFKDDHGTIEAQTGTIEFGSGFANFTGTLFTGDGRVKITNDAYFKNVQSDNLELANGTFTGYAGDTFNGIILWTGGQFAGSLKNNADIIWQNGQVGGYFYNYGRMTPDPAGKSIISDNGRLYNHGQLEAVEDGLILSAANIGGTRGIFFNQNDGSLVKSNGSGTTFIGDVDFKDDHGTIEAQTGTIEFGSGFANFTGTNFTGSGNIKITNDAYFKSVQSDNLELANGTYTGYAGDSLNGTIVWTGGKFAGSFKNNADLFWQNGQVDGNFYNYGRMVPDPAGKSIITNGGYLYNHGQLEAVEDGLILSSIDNGGTRGTFYNEGGGILTKSGGTGTTLIGDVNFKDNSGTIDAQTGTIEFASGFASFTGTTFIGSGKVKITNDAYFKNILSENLELAGGRYTGFAGGALNGTILWTGGQFAGSFKNNADLSMGGKGIKSLAPNASFFNRGIFRGHGVIKTAGAVFYNHGILAPGNHSEKLRIDGDYHQMSEGILEIEISSTDSYDTLEISGTAVLAGVLNIFLRNGFTPVPGISFDILETKTLSGKFSAVNVTPLPEGMRLKIEYLRNKDGLDSVRFIFHPGR